jgi:hypothetical protein
MAPRDPNLAFVISELANSATVLLGIVESLRASVGATNADLVKLEGSVNRIVRALQRLQPKEGA